MKGIKTKIKRSGRAFKHLEVNINESLIINEISQRTGLKKYAATARIIHYAAQNVEKIFPAELEYEKVLTTKETRA